ncbi:MAG: ABC transporter ATP-binding protein [Candidatus Omnitrophica bacterium]|nr:ABC transporter ATP-binding protein [Candidatus Omnitrophota bacterium]
MNVIECQNVWKKFTKGEKLLSLRDAIPHFVKNLAHNNHPNGHLEEQEFWALKNINFTVQKGEVLGVIGPNGAGKSTMLKLLSRIIKPTKGSFAVNGRLSALIEITAGFHPDFTGRENVYFNGAILGMTTKEVDRKFDQIVDFSGVGEFIDTPVKRYSSGMYARLGFAVAAHVDPDVLLVDEVLSVGDMNFQAKCAEKMRELLNSGTTIALVSHNIPLVQSICSRILLLNHGEIIKDGSAEEVIPHYQDIIFAQSEEDLRKKIALEHNRIALSEDAHISIKDVLLFGENNVQSKNFEAGNSIKVEIRYDAQKPVPEPIIVANLIRADGVLCCSINTRDAGQEPASLRGEGKIVLELGQMNLMPGVYHLDVGIWDKEFVHPYAMRKSQIFRIESKELYLPTNAVFRTKAKWLV